MKKIFLTIFCILLFATALSACSSKEFPTGTYTRQAATWEYRDDGTFTIWAGDDVVTEGTYSIEGDEIQITDSLCNEEYAGSATYKWQHEDGVLSFELIGEDLCDSRREPLSWNWFGPK